MLAIVSAAEFLFSENCALKTVLLSRRVPQNVYEREASRLMKDPELSGLLHAKFVHLYDEIEQARDESEAVEELLRALPGWKKPLN